MKENIKYRCLNCLKENIIAHEIQFDLTKNVELYKKISDDSLFKYKCIHCKNEEIVFFESSFIDNLYKFYIRLTNDSTLSILDDENYINIRIVTSLNELKEKLRIFYSLLDDDLVEIIKYLIKEDLNKNNLIQIEDIYFYKKDDLNLTFILFSKEDYLGTINYSLIGYKNIYSKYKKYLNKKIQRVNEEYIKNILLNLESDSNFKA